MSSAPYKDMLRPLGKEQDLLCPSLKVQTETSGRGSGCLQGNMRVSDIQPREKSTRG